MRILKVNARSAGLLSLGTLLLGLGLSLLSPMSQAAVLTRIHDYRYLVKDLPDPENQYTSLVHEFEGLAFTADGSLWASIAPNDDPATQHFPKKQFWKLDLTNDQVAEPRITDNFQAPGLMFQLFKFLYGVDLVNPVALAASGEQLIVGENYQALRARGVDSADYLFAFTPGKSTPDKPDWRFALPTASCDGVQGAAFTAGKLYVTCQQSILQIDVAAGGVSTTFSLGTSLLGLDAIDDKHLLVGDYSSHTLRVFDLAAERFTEEIDLSGLFTGVDSDYFRLTGKEYSVQVIPSEGFRRIPDPDALAYRNGRIYMAFDGDLRIFEIAMSVPEPETLAIVTVALLGLAGLASGRPRRGRVPI